MRLLILLALLSLTVPSLAEDVIEYRNDGMEIWVDGIRRFTAHNQKVYSYPYATEGLAGVLYQATQNHRTARSYERVKSRIPGLRVKLHGLPLTVDTEVIDDDGKLKVLALPNEARNKYSPGHLMLEGLPLQIERQLYDIDGRPTTTEMIDNPARLSLERRYDQAVSGTTKVEGRDSIMDIVTKRNRL